MQNTSNREKALPYRIAFLLMPAAVLLVRVAAGAVGEGTHSAGGEAAR